MVENGVGKVLYKIELLLIKVIPFIIMFCYVLNNILYYFDIEVIFLSTFSGLSILTWIFLFAMYVHETLDDPDGCEGLVFNRWIADMKWLGIAISWSDFL